MDLAAWGAGTPPIAPPIARGENRTAARYGEPPVRGDRRADPPTSLDRLLHASVGRFTLGLSPAALWLAYADWALHLAHAAAAQVVLHRLCDLLA